MKLNSYTLGYVVAGAGWFIAGMALFGKFVIPYLSHGQLLILAIVLFSVAGELLVLMAFLLHWEDDDEIP
jgi:hypothetical protein